MGTCGHDASRASGDYGEDHTTKTTYDRPGLLGMMRNVVIVRPRLVWLAGLSNEARTWWEGLPGASKPL